MAKHRYEFGRLSVCVLFQRWIDRFHSFSSWTRVQKIYVFSQRIQFTPKILFKFASTKWCPFKWLTWLFFSLDVNCVAIFETKNTIVTNMVQPYWAWYGQKKKKKNNVRTWIIDKRIFAWGESYFSFSFNSKYYLLWIINMLLTLFKMNR